MSTVSLVIPTVGRPSLKVLLDSLAAAGGPLPQRVVLVDDRAEAVAPLPAAPGWLAGRVKVLRGAARGPAAARNVGWRAVDSEWVAFLDDDVVVPPEWLQRLATDLSSASADVGGVQGRIVVPLPDDRRASDWERNVAGLEQARWATADLAYRRTALDAVGGFDERFPRAYREDADLGLRVSERGWRIVPGTRRTMHPVRPANAWVSVRLQAGNADDATMRALHGRDWRRRAGVHRGTRHRHLATTALGLLGIGGTLLGQRRLATAGLGGWLLATAWFAGARIAPGPRTPCEVLTMLATSVAIPPAATLHWLRGWRAAGPPRRSPPRAAAVLFDRDGTLIADEPYNGDPDRVRPVPGAKEALDRLRRAGLLTAVVSNQSGVARGTLTAADVTRVNHRVEELLGPLGPWLVCTHGPLDDCGCRKPAPGLVRRAAKVLGIEPADCVVVGDIGADVEAARAAGARSVLVPTAATRRAEIADAECVAASLPAAIDLILRRRI